MVNIVVCDDDASFQEIMTFKINQCLQNKFEMDCKISVFDKLTDLKTYIEGNKVDILFLDIMINDENAMDWSIQNIKKQIYSNCIYDLISSMRLQHFGNKLLLLSC